MGSDTAGASHGPAVGDRAGASGLAVAGWRGDGEVGGYGELGGTERFVAGRSLPCVSLDRAAGTVGTGGLAGRTGSARTAAAMAGSDGRAVRAADLVGGDRDIESAADLAVGAGAALHRAGWRRWPAVDRGKPALRSIVRGGIAGGGWPGVGSAGGTGAGTAAGADAEPAVVRAGWLALPAGGARLRGAGHRDGRCLADRFLVGAGDAVRSGAAVRQRDVESGHGVAGCGIGERAGRAPGVLARAVVPSERLAVRVGIGGRGAGVPGHRSSITDPVGAVVRCPVPGGATLAQRRRLARVGAGAAIERAGLERDESDGFQPGHRYGDCRCLGLCALVRRQPAAATLERLPTGLGGGTGVLAAAGFDRRSWRGRPGGGGRGMDARRRAGRAGAVPVIAVAQYRMAGNGLAGGRDAGWERLVGRWRAGVELVGPR